ERYGARQGGQSDFMMLMVIDHPDNEVHLLQIDRDTIAEVETFGILGNPIGTKAMQICLAHSFGNSEEQSCKVAQNAVSNLLQGIDIDFYISVNMDSMALLNKTLRGVPVTLEDDFSEFDPMMTEGAEITLTDEQAEIFMRARMEIGDGTNASRMRRHRMFINNAMEKFKRLASEDADYINTAYEEMESALNMDISKARLLNEANRAYRYEIRPIKTLDGSYMVGDDGFIEFHADETSIVNWIVETLFREE
ncbi:MAG: LCP family protein, partial [Clostridia bacterium]|nr:LCP family protein [Clostridia bacterium]